MVDKPEFPGDKSPFGQNFMDQPMNNSSLEKWREQFNKCFPANAQMTAAQFKKFMEGLEKMISAQIKQEMAQMKKANEKLKRAEKGEAE